MNERPVPARERRALTAALGVTPESFGAESVRDLAAMPLMTLEAARSLPDELRLPFLRVVTAVSEHRWLPWFADAVVGSDRSPAGFGRGGVLLLAAPLRELLRAPVPELLARISDSSGSWHAFPASREQWERGNEFTGAPAFARRDLDYRWRAPEGVARVFALDPLPVERNPHLRARRWLASRLAATERHAGTLEAALRGAPPPSHDARVALAALRREQRGGAGSSSSMPGFEGPDRWYEAPDGGGAQRRR